MEHDERYARAREFYRRRHRPVGFLGRRRLRARRRKRALLRSREAARARSQGPISLGARAAEHRPADPGLAGDRPGRRLRGGPPARRRDRRGGVRRRLAARGRPRLLRRREGPHGRARPQSRPSQDPARRLRGRRRHAWRRRAKSAPSSTASSTTRARSPRFRSRSATTLRASIPTRRCPRFRESNASKSSRERVVALAKRENLTVRQLAQRLGGYAGLAFVGTPATIADRWRNGWSSEGCDGFNVMFPYLPEGLDDFVDKVVPELQRRGLFRREYEGATLRENLGLPRPANRFFIRPTSRGAVQTARTLRFPEHRMFACVLPSWTPRPRLAEGIDRCGGTSSSRRRSPLRSLCPLRLSPQAVEPAVAQAGRRAGRQAPREARQAAPMAPRAGPERLGRAARRERTGRGHSASSANGGANGSGSATGTTGAGNGCDPNAARTGGGVASSAGSAKPGC